MNSRGVVPIIVVAILALALTGLGLFIYLQKPAFIPPKQVACTQEAKICPDGTSVGRSGPNCEFPACPAIKPSPESTSSADMTNWKTYTNQNLGYSFRYPFMYSLVACTIDCGQMLDDLTLSPPHDQANIHYENIFINVSANSTGKTINSYLDGVVMDGNKIPKTQIIIDGQQGVRVNLPGEFDYDTVIIIKGNKIFDLRLNKVTGGSEELTFSQILSTFKFIQ